ncbi:hypothetical protein L6270_00670 [Candidatus Parcubacteria bacterium]|nr:hypothetical protein [Patescibacteria group bacterium]MBU4309663.1 hypothetical protein [Patescibacteria group bacterium]MBU4432013.1 hypothetical protein [Patescibacteria group bacterium]MBU4577949.1 hypothetical protein [Patescibacteria group bacterium]MCG2696542.1 hypothetical protein [Candidatus Parcubacteria bacterium]
MDAILGYWWIIPIVATLVGYKLVLRFFFGAVIIAEDEIGIVNKKFVLWGANRTLPDGAIIALEGEAGYQADTLAPGLHWGLFPWQYEVERVKFITIERGKIGVVESRDGIPLSDGRVLAKRVGCDSFQSARMFLENQGERGPQITIIPPGTYRINTRIFSVNMENMLEIADGMVGIVTTKEGQQLPAGDIAGKAVGGHNSFQDGQSFVTSGGYKGMQEQVILAGRYYINPRFATVEVRDMTSVPIAHAGVVVAFVGEAAEDTTGANFKHGNQVPKGCKGVWNEPYDPGKYPVNSFTHTVELVPTANIVLNWADAKTEAHNLDANLSTITVRSSDGFTLNLDVAQIIHIPRNDAPKVISRFGTVANMVTQVLEPIIGNYFRNAAQSSDAIDFLKDREKRQSEAKAAIQAALQEYDVQAVDTLIGDIVPPAELMKTLTNRKIAEQEEITYGTQKKAEDARMTFEQSKAMAATQANVVASERKVTIADFDAQAAVKQADGVAKSKKINAEADAEVIKVVGNATAERTKAIGTAEAEVIERKIQSMESGNFAMIEVAKALGASGQKWVPEIVMHGGADGKSSNSIADVLMANLIKDNLAPAKPLVKKPKEEKLNEADLAEDKTAVKDGEDKPADVVNPELPTDAILHPTTTLELEEKSVDDEQHDEEK